jgi:hypothetical protein
MSLVVKEMDEEDRLLSPRVTLVGSFCFELRNNHAKWRHDKQGDRNETKQILLNAGAGPAPAD